MPDSFVFMELDYFDQRRTVRKADDSKIMLQPMIPKTKLKVSSENNDVMNGYLDYMSGGRIFFAYFGILPSCITIAGCDMEKVIGYLEKQMIDRITVRHETQHFTSARNKYLISEALYILEDRLMLMVEERALTLLYHPGDLERAKGLVGDLKRFRRKKNNRHAIHLIMTTEEGLDTKSLKVPKPRLSLATHYNDDLMPVHERLMATIKKSHTSGIFLLHGVPGSGKSTYIRHLIHSIRKKVLFLSPNLCMNLDTPAFTQMLVKHQETVFIVEDAEELLLSRENGRNSSISMLLNLTDGLLGESLGIQIIATFNTDLRKIDKALLRKGRLMGMYEFKPLSAEKTGVLLSKQGFEVPGSIGPMTLADIYNYDEPAVALEMDRPQIGFNSMKD